MTFHYLFAGMNVVAGVVTLGVARWVWHRRDGRTAATFVAMLCLVTIWAVAVAGSLVLEAESGKLPLQVVAQVVALFVPPLWFLFTLQYTGRLGAYHGEIAAALFALGVAITALTVTNDAHHLVWADTVYHSQPFPYLETVDGAALNAYLAFSYVILLVGAGVMLKVVQAARDAHRSQPAVLAVAVLFPLLLNVGTHRGLLPVTGLDYTPIGIGAFSVLTGWALYRHRLFDLHPVDSDTVMDAIRDAVVVLTGDGRIADYNPSGEALLADDAAIGTPLVDALPFHLDPATYAEPPATHDLTAVVDGETRHYLLDVAPLEDDGRERGAVLIFRDVTETRRQRRELERQAEHMERFAASVSHDLRNPLNVAQAAMEAFETDRENAEIVRDSHRRMNAIIEDALAFARSGRRVTETEPVDLAAVATDAWDSVGTDAATLRLDGDAVLLADRSRLRRLLENLYRNAVEHGSTSSRPQADDSVEHGNDAVEIRVGPIDAFTADATAGSTSREPRPDASADDASVGESDTEPTRTGFYVADDGPGIPPDEREDVFDHGYTTREDGTGFGLAIVAAIAGAHEWSVDVTEGRDGGARFEFTDCRFVDGGSVERAPGEEAVPAEP